MKPSRTHQLALYGILIALAFILSWLETFLPNPLEGMVPGIKLGLANLVIIIALYLLGFPAAVTISLIRVLLTAFTFGNLSMLFYSLSGAVFSILTMLFLKKLKVFSSTGISIAGGLSHNLGQITVAVLILGKNLIYYLPYLFLGGCISGLLIGLLASLILQHLPPVFSRKKTS